MSPVELPRELRQILARLELLSHGTTANWAPTGGGESAAVFPPGEKTPPHLYWRDKWLNATDEDGRTAAWKGAKSELEALSTRSTRVEIAVESESELEKRIIHDGKGWTVDEVAQHMRCTPTFVRKARLRDGRSVVTGHKPDDELDGSEDQREKARRLAADGLTERQIAMHTKLSKSTVRRMLGKAA